MTIRATYAPEDNKIRLYPSERLDRETYDKVRAAGYIWAPKQGLFVAPMWTPEREDLAISLAGEIEDEDTSLIDRAEERADRFDGYVEKREADGERAQEAVASLADGIPLGQPILVGHHSERRARKDAERIESGLRKAVKAFETAEYWRRRADGAIAHAKYKEIPAVRARRIKTLEADRRKRERAKAEAEGLLKFWRGESHVKNRETGERQLLEINEDNRALIRRILGMMPSTGVKFLGVDGSCYYTARDCLRPESERYKNCPIKTVAEVQESAIRLQNETIARCDRWLAHYDNRLVYERAMLGESGYQEPPKRKSAKAAAPLLNLRGIVSYRDRFGNAIHTEEAHHMTKAEYAAATKQDRTYTVISADGTHRLRAVILPGVQTWTGGKRVVVFLTDSAEHERPSQEAIDAAKAERERREDAIVSQSLAEAKERRVRDTRLAPARAEAQERRERIRALKTAAKSGVVVAVAPGLFPTPAEIVDRMLSEASIGPGMTVLEPSAGTGNIAKAVRETQPDAHLDLIEINRALYEGLIRDGFPGRSTFHRDFLEVEPPSTGFDRVLMNPPFDHGSDIRHIRHALTFLKPGGRLVAICANGPKQRAELMPEATLWEDLPPGTFASQGTNVQTAMVVIDA